MSLIADAVQPLLPQGLFALRGRLDDVALPDILVTPRIGYQLGFNNVNQSILMNFGGDEEITSAIAFDINRLAAASFQTVCALEDDPVNRDNLAWSLVKLYYSAFYAGHVVLRLLGESCSYFDKPQITRIAEIAAAIGANPTFRVNRGFYRCVLTNGATALECTRASGMVGGAHEAFWEVFGNRIGTLTTEILRGPLVRADAQAVFTQLEELRSILRIQGAASWLSVIRNDVQYRHRYGVWFPSSVKKPELLKLGRVIGLWKADPMNINLHPRQDAPLGPFASAATFIIAFCHVILIRIAERSLARAQSFVQFGPMAYLKMRG